jgi:putative thioredoxin
MRGAVDLGALATQRQAQAQADQVAGHVPEGVVISVDDANFEVEVLARSVDVPIVLNLTASSAAPGQTMTAVLTTLAAEYGGRFVLANLDVQASPMIAQALQIQTVPSVVAFIKSQPVPLFQGTYPIEEVRQVIDQVLTLAAENGVTGTATGGEPQPVEPPTDPRLDAVYDAIEQGDYDAAEALYKQMLRDNPADTVAKAGISQVELLRRTDALDPIAVQAAAAAGPDDIDAQLRMGDLEMMSGQYPEAFERLIGLLKNVFGDDRETVRVRLVEFFDIAGPDEPSVPKARKAMAAALF